MRKFYLLLFVSFLSITTFSQDIIGNWDFNFILPDTVEVGENLKPISDDDKMQINADFTFNYEISESNLVANGEWKLEEGILALHYDLPIDTIRFYQISLTEEDLILNENGINYAFVKERVHSSAIATSGFSISSLF